MPPEPLPWDRKEYLFKDHRKHERGDALGGGGGSSSAPRWRDPYHGPRDLPRASPRRSLSGHYRQGGGYHQVQPEDSIGHGCTPSRPERLWFEDDGFRSSSARYGSGGHRSSGGGTSRESRGSFRRSPYWDSSDISRQHHHDPHVTPQRSVTTPISSASPTPLKDQNGKTGSGVDDGLDTGHIFEQRDHSLSSIPWKKWSRPATVTLTRTGRSDSQEAGLETILPSGKENPIRSPVTSSLPPDEVASKKKPRLGWGQGLAKYEKQKVEGSVESSLGSGKGALSDSSQRNAGISGCLSPATPCSATCSSSPGTEDKSCSKATNDDVGSSQMVELPGTTYLHSYEQFSLDLDKLEVNPISSLDALLADMFQSEDAFSGESTTARYSAMSKLSSLKDLISNGLEKIEFEIDLLEKELKSMVCDPKGGACQASFKLEDVSVSDTCLQPLAGVSEDSNITEKQKVVENVKVEVAEDAPFCRLVEEDALIEDVSIIHADTVSCKINKAPDLTREHSDRKSLLPEVEGLEVAKLPVIADTDNVESLIAACEDDKKNCIGAISSNVHSTDGIQQREMDSNLMTLIMDSSRNAANLASKMFDEVLPRNTPQLDVWGLVDFTSCRKNNLKIKEKLAARKSQLKFKERVLTLKFKALHFLWKEDLRLLSIRKLRTKSGKRVEVNRSLLNNSLKQRSSIRSRFSLPAGNLTLVPTTEIVNFTSKLLSDSQVKFYRNDLMMPALLLDENERKSTKFITQNGLVEDPPGLEKERAMINPWSHDEREIFMEMLAQVGKDFTKISSVLSHKTTADCIEFYYRNHKSDSFKEVKKRLVLRKQQQCLPTNTYLVASGKAWNHDLKAASLDILGAASFVAAHSHGTVSSQKYARRTANGTYDDMKLQYKSYGHSERASTTDVSMQERESAAADMLVGICGALSSEAMSSCITSSADPSDKTNFVKMDQMFTSELSGNQDEEDACSDEGLGELDSADWTDEEKSVFIKALSIYGKDFAKISTCMKTRSKEQCKIFFSKARKCLGLDAIQQGSDNRGRILLSDANGGRSDTDDACAAEMDSAICSTQSCSKVDIDVSQSVANTSYDETVHAASMHSNAETNVSDEQNEDASIGPRLEAGEENTDKKQVCIFPADRLTCQGDNIQSNVPTKESVAAAAGCSDSVVKDSSDREAKVTEICNIVSPNELVAKACVKTESKLSSSTMIQNAKIDGGFAANCLKLDTKRTPVTKACLSDEKLSSIDFRANVDRSLCSEMDFDACGTPLLSENKPDVHPHHLSFSPSHKQKVRQDLVTHLSKKHQSIFLKQGESHSVSPNSFFADPSSICFGGSINESSRTTLNFEDYANKLHAVKRDLYQQYMLRNSPVNQVDCNIHVLRGYPLQSFNQEVKRAADLPSEEKQNLRETDSKYNGVTKSNNSFTSDMQWKKSNLSNLSNSRSDISWPSRIENQSEGKNGGSDTEEHKTGDVKLFGQILSHPTSLQKSSSSSHENSVRHPSPSLEVSSSINCTSNGKEGSRFVANAGSSSVQVVSEELPLRNGFWDAKRIQTGSTLPEAAAVLAKYQEPLAGVSFYSSKTDGIPSCTSILTEYHHQPYAVPQLSSDGKRLDTFADLQKRSGTEMVVSGFQQQGRAATPLDANTMAGGGMLVGGGVSDPVAALKLHYAAAARAKVLGGGEVESWRGDIGGR